MSKRNGIALGKKLVISATIIALFVAGSYLLEYGLKSRALSSGTMIKVNSNGKLSALMGVDLIKELKKKESGDQLGQGPQLSSVITAAGVAEFDRVEVRGVDDQSIFRIKKAEVGPELVIWYTDHGTVELRKKSKNKDILVKDISQIDTYTNDR